MRTQIEITGQIMGNGKLRNYIGAFDDQIHKIMFNGYRIEYKTKKDAKKALREAYKSMKADDYEVQLFNDILSYDASRAIIVNEIV